MINGRSETNRTVVVIPKQGLWISSGSCHGSWHHHLLGDGGLLSVLQRSGSGSSCSADSFPALLPGALSALLHHPWRDLWAESHCLQLSVQVHHGETSDPVLSSHIKYATNHVCLTDRLKWLQLLPQTTLSKPPLMTSIHPVCVLMEEKPLNGSSLLLFLVSFPVWIIVSQCLCLLYLHVHVLCCRSLEYYSQCRGRGVPDCVWQWNCERARERTHWHSHTKSACTGQSTSNGSQTSFIHDPNAAYVNMMCWCYCFILQAEGTEKTETYSWLLCPKGLYAIILGLKHR